MGERLKDLSKAREELRAKVKALPVAERVQAARLFELFERAVAVEEELDRASDKTYKVYDEEIFRVTEQADAVVEGRRAAAPEDYAFWQQHLDPGFVPPAEPDVPAPLPSFWRRFVQNAGLYSGEFDEPMLDALENVSVFREEAEEPSGPVVVLRAVFRFRANEFFSDGELSFRLFKQADDTLLRSQGCPIAWTRNPTVQKEVSKKKNKRTGEVRTFTKEVQKPSLFEVFGDFAQEDAAEEEDEGEEPRMNLLALAEFVDELQDCMPYALEYFLDLHPDEGSDGEDGDDDEESPAAAGPNATAGPAAPGDAAQPDGGNNCKQQ